MATINQAINQSGNQEIHQLVNDKFTENSADKFFC